MKYIGYPMAIKLKDFLWASIVSHYADKVIADVRNSNKATSEERHAIVTALNATDDATQRRALMSTLNKLH